MGLKSGTTQPEVPARAPLSRPLPRLIGSCSASGLRDREFARRLVGTGRRPEAAVDSFERLRERLASATESAGLVPATAG